MDGLDKELGFDTTEDNASEDSEIINFQEEKKKTRKQFHHWNVGGRDYKLKLTTGMISRLEDKYRCNLLNIVSGDGIPRLSIMLTIIQAAMDPWQHGTKYKVVEGIYDKYLTEGGSQIKLLSDVIMPIMAVSGFFTESQTEDLMDKMKEMDETPI